MSVTLQQLEVAVTQPPVTGPRTAKSKKPTKSSKNTKAARTRRPRRRLTSRVNPTVDEPVNPDKEDPLREEAAEEDRRRARSIAYARNPFHR